MKDLAVIVEEFRMDRHLHAVLDFGEQSLTSGINLGIKYVYSRAFLPVPRASSHSDCQWAQADLRLVSAQSPRPPGLAPPGPVAGPRQGWPVARPGDGHGPCTGGHVAQAAAISPGLVGRP